MAADDCPPCPDAPKCPDCPPPGAPGWMATFSDLVTLLLTFFILLYALSKQDSAKFTSMAGSVRKAFAGNAMNIGETVQLGKSPDDSPTMIENQEPLEPFPIDMITSEGMLDKLEINRESEEDLKEMKEVVREFGLTESVDIYQMGEGIKFRIKDRILFERGASTIQNINVEVFQKLIKLMQDNDWSLFVEGYADHNEKGPKGIDPLGLSSLRAQEVTKSLIQRGVRPEKITTINYGDSRAVRGDQNSKVEFMLRKIDLKTEGKRVNPY